MTSLTLHLLPLHLIASYRASHRVLAPYPLKPYFMYLDDLVSHARKRVSSVKTETADERAAVLRSILVNREGYQGVPEDAGHPDNAHIPWVIDHKKGFPVSLGIFYLHIARHMSWPAVGLNFPGHFLVRISGHNADHIILDPFQSGLSVSASDLRELYKNIHGRHIELHPHVYTPMSNRDILLRLHIHVRHHALQNQDYPIALAAIEKMLLITPSDFKLWREKGLLHMRLCKLDQALAALEKYLALAPPGPERDMISKVMDELHRDTL